MTETSLPEVKARLIGFITLLVLENARTFANSLIINLTVNNILTGLIAIIIHICGIIFILLRKQSFLMLYSTYLFLNTIIQIVLNYVAGVALAVVTVDAIINVVIMTYLLIHLRVYYKGLDSRDETVSDVKIGKMTIKV